VSEAEAKAVGVTDLDDEEDGVDVADVVDRMDTVATGEAVEPEITTKVCASIAKLTVKLQMYAERGNAVRREGTMMSASTSSGGSQNTSKPMVSPTNVYRSGGK
jgi:hypothetical protein